MSTEYIDIVVRERGSSVARRNIEDIGTSAEKTARTLETLKNAIAAYLTFESIRKVVELADAYQNVQNRLRTVTDSAQQLAVVTERLYQVSQQTRSSFQGTAELYARLGVSSKELGITQNQLIDFTKSLNQAIILSGASAAEAQAGLIQLSQGMASGTLRGDELRSVLEQLPAVADVIAQHMGVTRGELRQLGFEGKITAQTIIAAFQEAGESLDEKFAKTIPTVSQSFQMMSNAFMKFVGEVGTSTGILDGLSRAMMFVAENIDVIGKALEALAITIGVIAGARGIGMLVSGLGALASFIVANPFTAMAVGITAAAAAMVMFGDKVKVSRDGLANVHDLANAMWPDIKRGLQELATTVGTTFQQINTALGGVFGTTIEDNFRRTAAGIDAWVGLWRGAVEAVKAVWERLPEALTSPIKEAFNSLVDYIQQLLNSIIAAVNSVIRSVNQPREAFGVQLPTPNIPELSSINIETMKANIEPQAEDLGDLIWRKLGEGVNGENGATDAVNRWFDTAENIARDRLEQQRHSGLSQQMQNSLLDVTVGTGGGSNAPSLTKEQISSLTNAMDQLRERVDPVAASLLDYAQTQKQVKEATAAGIITQTEAARLQERLAVAFETTDGPLAALRGNVDSVSAAVAEYASQQRLLHDALDAGLIKQDEYNELLEKTYRLYEDQIDPLGAVNRELDQQLTLAGMSADQREVENQLISIQNALRQQGVDIGEPELEQLREKLGLLQRTNKLQSDMATAYQDINGAAETFQSTAAALNQLLADGRITVDQYNDSMQKAMLAFAETQNTWQGGLVSGLLRIKEEFGDVNKLLSETLVNAFRGAEDALVKFVRTGKLNFGDLVDSMLEDLARLAMRMAVTGPLAEVLGGVGQSLFKSLFSGMFSSGGFGSTGAPFNGSGSSWVFHNGGIVGQSSATRTIADMSVFNTAPRFHNGTPFASDEVPAVLKRGEMVGWPDQMAKAFGNHVNVTVLVENNSGNAEVTTEETDDGQGNFQLKLIIEDIVSDGIVNRKSKINRSLRSNFGLDAQNRKIG